MEAEDGEHMPALSQKEGALHLPPTQWGDNGDQRVNPPKQKSKDNTMREKQHKLKDGPGRETGTT